MELRFAFVANSAEVGPDGRFFVLGGGIDGIGVPSVPCIFPALTLLIRVHFWREECREAYQLHISMMNPDGTDSPIAATVTGPQQVQTMEGFEELGANLDVAVNLFNIPFTQTGIHAFRI